MATDYRVMNKGKTFEIQQSDDGGNKWETVGEFDNIADAKEMVRDLRSQQ